MLYGSQIFQSREGREIENVFRTLWAWAPPSLSPPVSRHWWHTASQCRWQWVWQQWRDPLSHKQGPDPGLLTAVSLKKRKKSMYIKWIFQKLWQPGINVHSQSKSYTRVVGRHCFDADPDSDIRLSILMPVDFYPAEFKTKTVASGFNNNCTLWKPSYRGWKISCRRLLLKGIGSPSRPKYTCHGRFTEQFSESQPGSGASFTVTGGFLNAAQQPLWRGWLLEGFLKLVSFLKEQGKTWHLIIFAIKPKKNISPAHIQKVGYRYWFNFRGH